MIHGLNVMMRFSFFMPLSVLDFSCFGKIIFWKDVVEITEDYSRWDAWLVFEMIDERKVNISTKWATGSNSRIYEIAQEYFRDALEKENRPKIT